MTLLVRGTLPLVTLYERDLAIGDSPCERDLTIGDSFSERDLAIGDSLCVRDLAIGDSNVRLTFMHYLLACKYT